MLKLSKATEQVKFMYDSASDKTGRAFKAMTNAKLLWRISRYMVLPIFTALKPFPATTLNVWKNIPAPFIELLLDEGYLQFGFLCHDIDLPNPQELDESELEPIKKKIRRMGAKNFNMLPHMYHLLDIGFLAEIEKAYRNNLPIDVTLFGTGLLISDEVWQKAMVRYLVSLRTQLGIWVKDRKEYWEGHPAELRLLDQVENKLVWMFDFKMFDSWDVGLHFETAPKPFLTPTLISSFAIQLQDAWKGYLWVSEYTETGRDPS